jgi:Tfp pilus assembly protein PilX
LIWTASLCRAIADRRGSTLFAALALVLLIFAVVTVCLARVASIYTEAGRQRGQTCALYLAEAGLQKAAHRLTQDASYSGEKQTRLPTGCFDVKVTRAGSGYAVVSTGYADSPLARHPKRTVRATVTVTLRSPKGGAFAITNWRENR